MYVRRTESRASCQSAPAVFRERMEVEKRAAEAAAKLKHQQCVENEARQYLAKEDIERQRRIAEKIQQAEARNATVRLRVGAAT